MGNKQSNAQVAADPADMSKGISTAFGDDEAAARRRKQQEDAAAQANSQETSTGPSAWDTMKSMASDAAAGAKDVAKNPGGVWDVLTNKDKKKN